MKLLLFMVLLAGAFSIGSSFKPIRSSRRFVTRSLSAAVEEPIVIPPNYNLAIGSFGITLASIFTWNLWTGIPFALLSVLFAVQTGKVRFVFDNEAIELKINKKGNKTLDPSRENVVVGGKNRWDYSTIVNWFFIPSKNFPILVYFKETQTPTEDGSGQVHFFPVITNWKKLYEVMNERIPLVRSAD